MTLVVAMAGQIEATLKSLGKGPAANTDRSLEKNTAVVGMDKKRNPVAALVGPLGASLVAGERRGRSSPVGASSVAGERTERTERGRVAEG